MSCEQAKKAYFECLEAWEEAEREYDHLLSSLPEFSRQPTSTMTITDLARAGSLSRKVEKLRKDYSAKQVAYWIALREHHQLSKTAN